MRTVQKILPLLHRVVLHYKIISDHNTWHTSAVPGVENSWKHSEICFSAWKFQIFAALFRYSTLSSKGIEKWKYENERLERKFFVSYISAESFHCRCKSILPFLWSRPNTCIVAGVKSAFSFLWVHSEFEYRSFISSYDGNETSFGR
jgi:hypothetical protein